MFAISSRIKSPDRSTFNRSVKLLSSAITLASGAYLLDRVTLLEAQGLEDNEPPDNEGEPSEAAEDEAIVEKLRAGILTRKETENMISVATLNLRTVRLEPTVSFKHNLFVFASLFFRNIKRSKHARNSIKSSLACSSSDLGNFACM